MVFELVAKKLQVCIFLPIHSLSTVLIHSSGFNYTEALQVIQGLLRTVPSFWGAELLSVSTCCFEMMANTNTDSVRPFTEVLDAVAERVPARILLPSLVQLWDQLSPNAVDKVRPWKYLSALTCT